MTVDTTELRSLLDLLCRDSLEIPLDVAVAHPESGKIADAFCRLNAMHERLVAELDRMRPYAVRCGYGADEEWLSSC